MQLNLMSSKSIDKQPKYISIFSWNFPFLLTFNSQVLMLILLAFDPTAIDNEWWFDNTNLQMYAILY